MKIPTWLSDSRSDGLEEKNWYCKSCCALEAAENTQLQEHRTLSSLDCFPYLCYGQGRLQPMSSPSQSAHNMIAVTRQQWWLSVSVYRQVSWKTAGFGFWTTASTHWKHCTKFLSGLGVACPVPSARCPCHRQHSHVGTITNFQQKKTEGPWALISHPTPGKYFYLVKLEVIAMKCIDKEGFRDATHIKHFSGRNLTL